MLKRLSADTPDCVGRGVLWRNVIELIAQRPWSGWGWSELPFAMYAGEFNPRFCVLVENAHNLPLHLAVELGLPAALLVCLACVWAIAKGKPWADTDPSRRLGWGVLLVLGIHSLVEYPLWYGPFQLALGLSLGLLWRGIPVLIMPRMAMTAWAFAFAAFAWYAGSDYRRVSQLYLPAQSRAPSFQDDSAALPASTWLFRDHAEFAALLTAPLTPETAPQLFQASTRVLHYSPEPRVIEKRIQSARLLGRDTEATAEVNRYRVAFPAQYTAWARQQPAR
jgi:hypothetical protein